MKSSLAHFNNISANTATHENIGDVEDFPFMYRLGQFNDEYTPNHWHESLEIIYIESGHLKVELNGSSYDLYGDDFIIINSGDIHNSTFVGPTRHCLLQLPPSFISTVISDYSNVRFENPALPGYSSSTGIRGNEISDRIRSDLSLMSNVFTHKNEGYKSAFLSLLYDLLFILDTEAKVNILEDNKTKSEKNREILTQVTTYVSHHYKETIRLSDAAKVAGLQQEYFCRFFKKFMGISFMDYVNEVRFSHVYSDLISTDYSIQRILENHGFTNYKLFMRMFKTRYNTTPAAKRRQARQANL